MTRDEIVRLWDHANNWGIPISSGLAEDLKRFADFVAAFEREECAKIVEKNVIVCKNNLMLQNVLNGNAAAIRARGEISKEELQ